jgi:hypothetical protein
VRATEFNDLHDPRRPLQRCALPVALSGPEVPALAEVQHKPWQRDSQREARLFVGGYGPQCDIAIVGLTM